MRALVTAAALLALTSSAYADGVHDEVVAFAAGRGQTEDQFASEIDSTPQKVEAFVYASEQTGSNAVSALRSLIGMHEAMKDPNKRVVIMCMGVDVYTAETVKPSEAQCRAAKQKLGID